MDSVAAIQQSAALALGRLANFSPKLAESVVTHEILPQLVYSLAQQNRGPVRSAGASKAFESGQRNAKPSLVHTHI